MKAVKHRLRHTLTSASLPYEELETIVTEIEPILNSRLITPMFTDPNDLTALTPGYFLIGEPLTTIVDLHATQHNNSALEDDLPTKMGLLATVFDGIS